MMASMLHGTTLPAGVRRTHNVIHDSGIRRYRARDGQRIGRGFGVAMTSSCTRRPLALHRWSNA